LSKERRAEPRGHGLVLRVARLHDDRDVGAHGVHARHQLGAGAAVVPSLARELEVRQDAEDVLLVLREAVPGRLERLTQDDLRARPHAQQPLDRLSPSEMSCCEYSISSE